MKLLHYADFSSNVNVLVDIPHKAMSLESSYTITIINKMLRVKHFSEIALYSVLNIVYGYKPEFQYQYIISIEDLK